MDGYEVIFESWEHWWGVSQQQQSWKRSVCAASIPTELSSRWCWLAQASCKDGRCFWHRKGMGCHISEGSRQHRDFGSKKWTGRRIFFGRLVINERQRTLCGGDGDQWRSHDTLWVRTQYRCWHYAAHATGCQAKGHGDFSENPNPYMTIFAIWRFFHF